MNRFQSALRMLPRDLRDASAPWALVGGMAVSARSISRFTNDFDVAVAVSTEAEAERIVGALLARGYSVNALMEDEDTHRMTTVRLNCPPPDAAPLIVDLLFATCGIEPEVVAAATAETVVPGLTMPVATTGHLIAMKVLANRDIREHDAADIGRLLEVADEKELARAWEGVRLITERGFDREKDLVAEFERFLALHASRE